MQPDSNLIIDRLGGPTKAARICEVTAPAVCAWRTNGIPKARLQFLQLARPDIFADPEMFISKATGTTD